MVVNKRNTCKRTLILSSIIYLLPLQSDQQQQQQKNQDKLSRKRISSL